ncbi:MAG: hypothetical protein PHC68_09245 [Syntrophorhabdaceae bacterium]|nr:hypothetical protein [Syntrophorhabdaceae bacterium]
MKDLIEALQIFLKYKNETYPTHCEHDVMYIMDVTKEEVSEEDRKRLGELGFIYDEDSDEGAGEGWMSFKYGSA